MRQRLATYAVTALVRASIAAIALAERIAAKHRAPAPPPVTVYDAMSLEDELALADGEILAAALRGVSL